MTEVARPADLAASPDVIVIAVKAFDVEAAAHSCAAWPGAVALTVSNGIGAEELVQRARPSSGLIAGSVTAAVEVVGNRVIAQDDKGGALPTLYAAVTDIPGNSYAGPSGFMEGRGAPTLVGRSGAAQDMDVARRLWDVSEQLTHVSFPLTAQPVTRA